MLYQAFEFCVSVYKKERTASDDVASFLVNVIVNISCFSKDEFLSDMKQEVKMIYRKVP